MADEAKMTDEEFQEFMNGLESHILDLLKSDKRVTDESSLKNCTLPISPSSFELPEGFSPFNDGCGGVFLPDDGDKVRVLFRSGSTANATWTQPYNKHDPEDGFRMHYPGHFTFEDDSIADREEEFPIAWKRL